MNDNARPELTRRRPTSSRKIRPSREAESIQRRPEMPSTQELPAQEEIEKLAYQLWEERGAPLGSPEIDWERAEQALRENPQPGKSENP
jgi:Protein of unknown function (DUF2934)